MIKKSLRRKVKLKDFNEHLFIGVLSEDFINFVHTLVNRDIILNDLVNILSDEVQKFWGKDFEVLFTEYNFVSLKLIEGQPFPIYYFKLIYFEYINL